MVKETIVRAPAERVFSALVDPSQRSVWVASMRESGEGAPLTVGRVVDARRSAPTSRSHYRLKVLRLEAPRILEMDIERNGEHVGRATYELTPGAEGTMVRAAGEVVLRGMQRLAAPMVTRGMEDEMTVDLASLKKFVESG